MIASVFFLAGLFVLGIIIYAVRDSVRRSSHRSCICLECRIRRAERKERRP